MVYLDDVACWNTYFVVVWWNLDNTTWVIVVGFGQTQGG
jgi:hypothetical protein